MVAANRDEFYARPTAQAAFWQDNATIFAGRDLECGGTWLGVTRTGRFAAVTNFRDPADLRSSAESRGTLVSRFLAASTPAAEFVAEVEAKAGAYRGFNMLACDGTEMVSYSNRSGRPHLLGPGIYGLSNHLLDTPWPKVRLARERLAERLDPAPSVESLFTLLADTDTPTEDDLPDTGIGREREKMLSSARIVSETYGTRCSTVVLLGADGLLQFAERTYGPQGVEEDTVRVEFRLAN